MGTEWRSAEYSEATVAFMLRTNMVEMNVATLREVGRWCLDAEIEEGKEDRKNGKRLFK